MSRPKVFAQAYLSSDIASKYTCPRLRPSLREYTFPPRTPSATLAIVYHWQFIPQLSSNAPRHPSPPRRNARYQRPVSNCNAACSLNSVLVTILQVQTVISIAPPTQLERRRLKVLAAELARAFEEVQTRTDDTDERRREAEAVKTEALASAKAATKEREAAQLRSVQVEKVARRLEAERTSVAQARAWQARE